MKKYIPRPEVLDYLKRVISLSGNLEEVLPLVGPRDITVEGLLREMRTGSTEIGRTAYTMGCLLYDAQHSQVGSSKVITPNKARSYR